MIEPGTGNLLASDAEALVNTVNTVGVMGKGIALQFKQAFPANYRAYRAACDRGDVVLGRVFVWDSKLPGPRRYIVNFPTKGHWRSRSRIEDVRAGLADLARVVDELGIRSVAVPALGCGNGGLDWADVEPLIRRAFASSTARVVVFAPAGAPPAHEMPVGTDKPSMTPGRAALLAVVARYARAAMRERFDLTRPGASLLEIQKLLYLLQEAGRPLRLRYAKGRYGPYAENLNPALQAMEGHYLRGYGDRSQAVLDLAPIEMAPGAEAEAEAWLDADPGLRADVDRVMALIRGWESAYGLELLATVLFAARQDDAVTTDPARAIGYVHSWNKRKQTVFPEDHVTRAWEQLVAARWLAPNA